MSEYIVDFAEPRRAAIAHMQIKHHAAALCEEVVRCRDCKFAFVSTYDKETLLCAKNTVPIQPDGFCAWGVRKDDA